MSACSRDDHRPDATEAMCRVQLRCHRRGRCRGATPLTANGEKQRTKVGAVSDRPLCPACERSVVQVLADVPRLYVELEQTMAQRTTVRRNGGGAPSGPLGSPMLTNGRALYLQEVVHQLLTAWEDIVRDTAGLSMLSRHPFDEWERGRRRSRAGRETQNAARLLGAYLASWLGHPPVEYAVAGSTADPDDPKAAPDLDRPIVITEAGWQAAARLLDWRSHVRTSLGVTRAVTRRDEPCMYCEVKAIVEIAGEDHISCESCSRTWLREEYHAKVRGFEPYLRKLARAERAR